MSGRSLMMVAALSGVALLCVGQWLHERLARTLGIDPKASKTPPWVSPKGFGGWAKRAGRSLLVLIVSAVLGAVFIAAPPIVGRIMAIIVVAVTITPLCVRRAPTLLAAGANRKDVGLWLSVLSAGMLCFGFMLFLGAGALWHGR
jgi:hypothetical protein